MTSGSLIMPALKSFLIARARWSLLTLWPPLCLTIVGEDRPILERESTFSFDEEANAEGVFSR